MCRYAGRPAVATQRLTELPDGRLLYRLKRPWRDGTSAVIFERQDFMAKLAVLVPAPRAHLTRYHGVLAPAAVWRPLIIPTAPPPRTAIPTKQFPEWRLHRTHQPPRMWKRQRKQR
ncbi:MAG: IS91 family transposase, partial [Acidobacteria bacterium]